MLENWSGVKGPREGLSPRQHDGDSTESPRPFLRGLFSVWGGAGARGSATAARSGPRATWTPLSCRIDYAAADLLGGLPEL